jgi:hypothetical protein
VFHRDPDITSPNDKVHSAADGRDHLSRVSPVGQITSPRHLKCPENGQIEMTTSNEGERVDLTHVAATGHYRDRVLPRINEVAVRLPESGSRTHTKESVLAVKDDLTAFR